MNLLTNQPTSLNPTVSIDIGGIKKHSINTDCGSFGVRYVSGGSAPIVFIHGWMHSSLIWDRIPRELVAQRSVILLDLPGFGGERLANQTASLEQVAHGLREVLRALDTKEPVKTIVADSLGGILFLVGLDDPKWVQGRGIFLSGIPFDGLPAILRWLPIASLLPVVVRAVKRLPRSIGRRLVNSSIWFTVQLQPTVGDEIYDSVLAADPEAAVHFFQLLRTPLKRGQFVNRLKFAKRAILARGQFDRIVTREENRLWADIICADDCEIPGAGHTPMIEASRYYYRSILTMSC